MAFFTELEQIILKFVWKHKRPEQPKQTRKENKAGGIMLLNNKLQYKASHQNSMILSQKQTHRSVEQVESPEMYPHLYGQFITKEVRIYSVEKIVSSINSVEKT